MENQQEEVNIKLTKTQLYEYLLRKGYNLPNINSSLCSVGWLKLLFFEKVWCLKQKDTVFRIIPVPPKKDIILQELHNQLAQQGLNAQFDNKNSPDVAWAVLCLASVAQDHEWFNPAYLPIGDESRTGIQISRPKTILDAVVRGENKSKGRILLKDKDATTDKLDYLTKRKDKLNEKIKTIMLKMGGFNLNQGIARSQMSDSPDKRQRLSLNGDFTTRQQFFSPEQFGKKKTLRPQNYGQDQSFAGFLQNNGGADQFDQRIFKQE